MRHVIQTREHGCEMKMASVSFLSLVTVAAIMELVPAAILIAQDTAQKTAEVLQVISEGAATGIFTNTTLRACCIIGSFLGGLLAVTLGPSAEDTQTKMLRRMGLKFTASAISGIVFTPLVLRWIKMTPDVDTTLCISASVAFLSVMTLALFIPWYENQVKGYLDRFAAKRELAAKLNPPDKGQ